MLLAQGQFWQASLGKSEEGVLLSLLKSNLAGELAELRDLQMQIPLQKWNAVLKLSRSDRKLLGGVLLDFANHQDRLSLAIGNDRLLAELQRLILDATASLIEAELVTLVPAEG